MKMRALLRGVGLAWVVLLVATTARGFESLQGPTELLHWDKLRAFPGDTWFGVHGRTCLVQYQASLGISAWTTIASVAGVGTVSRFGDTDVTRVGRAGGFYRVITAR